MALIEVNESDLRTAATLILATALECARRKVTLNRLTMIKALHKVLNCDPLTGAACHYTVEMALVDNKLLIVKGDDYHLTRKGRKEAERLEAFLTSTVEREKDEYRKHVENCPKCQKLEREAN